MERTLEQLEETRERLYEQMAGLGDFRPGMISVNFRKCGKKNCACVQPGHPGHGPQYLWNTTQNGKSRAQNLHLGPELEKALKEVENYKRFNQLCQKMIEVNEQICRLRPVPKMKDEKEMEALKKNCAGGSSRSQGGDRPFDWASLPGPTETRTDRFRSDRDGHSPFDA